MHRNALFKHHVSWQPFGEVYSKCSFSTTAEKKAITASASRTEETGKQWKKKDDDGNLFLNNVGTIFLSAIGLVILSLVRSSYGTSNRNKLRDQIEEESLLDPLEIDDLRVANSELSPQLFRAIIKDVFQDFPQGSAKYDDFVRTVRATMKSLKGDASTVELGHLIDRIVDFALLRQGKTRNDEVSIAFYLTTLSLALELDASVSERIRLLYEVIEEEKTNVTSEEVVKLVGYLQDTCQLTSERQVIKGEKYFPVQEYKIATPRELLESENYKSGVIDIQGFSDILRSKSICAWGECYFKKKLQI